MCVAPSLADRPAALWPGPEMKVASGTGGASSGAVGAHSSIAPCRAGRKALSSCPDRAYTAALLRRCCPLVGAPGPVGHRPGGKCSNQPSSRSGIFCHPNFNARLTCSARALTLLQHHHHRRRIKWRAASGFVAVCEVVIASMEGEQSASVVAASASSSLGSPAHSERGPRRLPTRASG